VECLDCKISEIPEGHTGIVFLGCEDRKGKFYLCSPCWRKRQDDLKQMERERRQKLIDEETRGTAKKKKKSGARRGSNSFGPSH